MTTACSTRRLALALLPLIALLCSCATGSVSTIEFADVEVDTGDVSGVDALPQDAAGDDAADDATSDVAGPDATDAPGDGPGDADGTTGDTADDTADAGDTGADVPDAIVDADNDTAAPTCGNGVVEDDEECDPALDPDGICTDSCRIDSDGDGVAGSEGDCDDLDGDVFPEATEVCNGVDDNCNDAIDDVAGAEPCGLPQIVTFDASPTELVAGDEVTLRWEVLDADSVTLVSEPVGALSEDVEASGELVVALTEATTFVLTATNSVDAVERRRTVTVYDPLTVVDPAEDGALPVAIVSEPWEFVFAAEGGRPPLRWSVVEGFVPGLALDAATGRYAGAPPTANSYNLRVVVEDSMTPPQRAERAVSLRVRGPGPAIRTTTLADGLVGLGYSARIEVFGGSTPYTFEASGLPPGLTITSIGTITGIPTAAGTYRVAVGVTDSAASRVDAEFDLRIDPVLDGLPRALPAATVGVPYSEVIVATGGVRPLTWTAASALPTGLSLVAEGDDARIEGTPTAAGTFSFGLRVSDSRAPAQSDLVPLNLQVSAAAPVIGAATLPDGRVGVGYTYGMSATGGTPPLSWSATGLAPGLTIAPATGAITGSPTTAGSYTPRITVRDAASRSSSVDLAQRILGPAPVITTSTLPAGSVGVAYDVALTVTGGVAPLTWTVAGGALPVGLGLDPATGRIVGTPVSPAVASFSVRVSAADGQSDDASLELTIRDALRITTTELPDGDAEALYRFSLTAGGGSPPYTWSLQSESVPGAVTVSTSGLLEFTATTGGLFDVRVRVTDAALAAAETTLAVRIRNAPPAFVTSTLPEGRVGAAYAAIVNTIGGEGARTVTLASGALPPGIELAGSGALSGTPLAEGTYGFVLRATDELGRSVTQAFEIRVTPAPVAIPGYAALAGGWIDISSFGTPVAFSSQDDGVSVAAVPLGFAFRYFGADVSSVFVHTNGYVTTTSAPTFAGNFALGVNDALNGVLAPFWDDLFVYDFSGVFTATVGVAPHRRFVVQWKDLGFFADSTGRMNVAMVLHETTNHIQFLYDLSTSGSSDRRASGASATVGIESNDGSAAVTHALDTAGAVLPGTILTFTPSGAGYTLSSASRYSADPELLPGATVLALTGDDNQIDVPLPFAFSFWGSSQSTATVSTNGYLTFGSPATAFSNAFAASTSFPNNYIAAFWDDLIVDSGNVSWVTLGTAPNRRVVFSWNDVRPLSDTDARVNARITLYETTNVIVASWGRKVPGFDLARTEGASATVGIENADGSAAYIVSADARRLSEGLAVAWIPYSNANTGAYDVTVLEGGLQSIRDVGTRLGISTSDDAAEPVAIGFAFPVGAETRSQVYVSSNGVVTFDAVAASTFVPSLPSAGSPNGVFTALWSDLYPPSTTTGGIWTATRGAAGSRELVVQYDDIPLIGDTSARGTWQVILREDGTVRYEYGTMAPALLDRGTIGAESIDGLRGIVWSSNQRGLVRSGGRVDVFAVP